MSAIHEATVRDGRTDELNHPRRSKGRGWLVRRALVAADLVGLLLGMLAAVVVFGIGGSSTNKLGVAGEAFLVLAALPAWVLAARLYGLYDRDEERTDHSTVDDVSGVFQLVTLISWLLFALLYVTPVAHPAFGKVLIFWGVAVAAISSARALARAYCRRQTDYVQNAVIVGEGPIAQVIARKLLQHPEYGINVVGFVDAAPQPLRSDIDHLAHLGGLEDLPGVIGAHDVERVIVAFPDEPHERLLEGVRGLRETSVQIDLVPRLFELVGPHLSFHTVEGLPLLGLPPARLSRSSLALKRSIDVVGALAGLVLTAPLFAYAAWRIPRESPGPVLFRQQRLGRGMRDFTLFKFRTMRVGTDDTPHREYIAQTMSAAATVDDSGIYKLERSDAITPFGRWLRKTSLDEVPQLINVLRGDMSLVGPRPCIAYETESFEPHHFDRFLVPQGMTGLWQVKARARSTFGEALDLDSAYARSWSLGLDLALLVKTPIQMLRPGGTT